MSSYLVFCLIFLGSAGCGMPAIPPRSRQEARMAGIGLVRQSSQRAIIGTMAGKNWESVSLGKPGNLA